MYRIRSRFYKKEDMVFISHLDLIRLFDRAFRRANIPVSYSQGFNPHPIMAFATALGIGVSSEGEYIDIQLDRKVEANDFRDKLNEVLPEGLKLIKSAYIDASEESLMAAICRSVYIVKAPLIQEADLNIVEKQLKTFLNLDEIIEVKEAKKGNKRRHKSKQYREVNIRDLIYSIDIFSKGEKEVIFKMELAAGSKGNLKPEVALKKFAEFTKIPLDLENIRIHRLDLLMEKDGKYISPLDV